MDPLPRYLATAIEATVEALQIAEEANGKQIENVVGAALRRGGQCSEYSLNFFLRS
jgi:hypothetical protein